MRIQGYCDVYKWTILKRTSPEVKCLHPTSSRREMCTLSVSNVIYHKFSHGAAFYTLNGKNVNVMLEFAIIQVLPFLNNPKDLDPSYKMDLAFWDPFGREKKLCHITKEMWYHNRPKSGIVCCYNQYEPLKC